jgi:hypothetical protein
MGGTICIAYGHHSLLILELFATNVLFEEKYLLMNYTGNL